MKYRLRGVKWKEDKMTSEAIGVGESEEKRVDIWRAENLVNCNQIAQRRIWGDSAPCRLCQEILIYQMHKMDPSCSMEYLQFITPCLFVEVFF